MVLAMRLADWSGFDARRAEASARGRLLGRGLANYVESSVGTPREQARMTVRPEGSIEVVTGTQSAGQGHETSFAQVAADRLGLDVDTVRIRLGDTDLVGFGGGTHSGRSMRMAGAVIALAADDLIAEGKRRAARALEAAEADIVYMRGRFTVVGTNRGLDLFELPGGLAVVRDNEMHEPVFPNGCHVCDLPQRGALAHQRVGRQGGRRGRHHARARRDRQRPRRRAPARRRHRHSPAGDPARHVACDPRGAGNQFALRPASSRSPCHRRYGPGSGTLLVAAWWIGRDRLHEFVWRPRVAILRLLFRAA